MKKFDEEYNDWEEAELRYRAKLFREYRKAHGWTQSTAAAVFCVTPQTIINWECHGKFNDATYRQIYESDWGQAKFNPDWPKKFVRCGVGYSINELRDIWLAETPPIGAA